jgi:rhodanese-related sulfurtransferase
MERYGVPRVDAATVDAWRADARRTTYLFDVRTRTEVEARPVAGAVHTPGGQLLQATDQWVAVRGARLVLIDVDGVRAGVIAKWLRQMGHEVWVLERGDENRLRATVPARAQPVAPPSIDYASAREWRVLDLRGSMAYRRGHAPGARWSIRPRVVADAAGADRVALVGDDPRLVALAGVDLRESGVRDVAWIPNAPSTESTPCDPPDERCADHIFFTHRRHDGDRRAAEQYLEWEMNLVKRLTAEERGSFLL